MLRVFQRQSRLRRASRHACIQSAASPAAQVLDLQSPLHVWGSAQFKVFFQNLHKETNGHRSSPAAAPERRPFSRVSGEDLDYFRTILPGRTITDPDLVESSNVDWLKSVRGETQTGINLCVINPSNLLQFIFFSSCICSSPAGSSEVVLRPQTTEEVSQILR